MSETTYTDDEKKTLSVMKMQEDDLARLQKQNDSHHQQLDRMGQQLEQMKQRAKQLAEDEGVELPKERHYPVSDKPTKQIPTEDIPSWQSLEERAAQDDSILDVTIEDLLSIDEIAGAKADAKRINEQFAKLTGLSKRDIAFLSIAASIQTARWMMMPKIAGYLGKSGKVLAALSPSAIAMLETQANPDERQLSVIDEANREFQEEAEWDAEEVPEGEKSWEDILQDKDRDVEKTFNNDAMNWIFGIVNNITGTKTGSNFKTIDEMSGETVNTTTVFSDAFKSVKKDWLRLPAAVYAQYARHRVSNGEDAPDLLAPVTQAFSPEMVGDLYKAQFSELAAMRDITIIGQQAAIPLIINMAIGLLHGYMYNPETDGPREFYDARTRKILSLSNMLAAASNLTFTTITEDWTRVDVGGLMVTATRAIQDGSFLINLREEFIRRHLDKVYEKELEDIERHFQSLPDTTEHDVQNV